MKIWLFKPDFWFIFGICGFPLACFAGELMGMVALHPLGLMPKTGVPDFGWGGLPGVFLGWPLGIVSALVAMGWRNKRYFPARATAFVGGFFIGGFWLNLLIPLKLVVWVGDFGFIVPPLLWSLALLFFAIFARESRN